MKIATGIIGVSLSFIVGCESFAVGVGGALGWHKEAGGIGILVAILFLFGGAFAFALPKVSTIVFAISSMFAFIAATVLAYSDMYFWGGISIVLVFMSYSATKGSKRTSHAPSNPESIQPPPREDESVEKLQKLHKMLENKLITQEDFDKKKAEILSRLT